MARAFRRADVGCMSVGSVAGCVLRTDGQLGYAQPPQVLSPPDLRSVKKMLSFAIQVSLSLITA